MKLFLKTVLIFISLIFLFLIYMSIFGIETKRFNNQITKKIKKIDDNLNIELKKIKIVLDPFKFRLNAKTIGTKIKIDDKVFETEVIESQILLKSFFNDEFSLKNLEISTKSLDVKKFLSFVREFYNTPQLYIFEKILKKGYLIADIKIDFDSEGNIKDNYKIDGFVKDIKLDFFNKHEIEKINLIFSLNKNNLITRDIKIIWNNFNFLSEEIIIKKLDKLFLVEGKLENKSIEINNETIKFFLKDNFPNLDIKKIKFNSINSFIFKISKNFKFHDFEIRSDFKINELVASNNFNLKNIFPKISKEFKISNHYLKIYYKDKKLSIDGNGDVLFQESKDQIKYFIERNKNIYNFKSSLNVKNNPVNLKILNYKKIPNKEMTINTQGIYNSNGNLKINFISLKEKNNEILIKDLIFDNKYKIINFDHINLNYLDTDNYKNSIQINKKTNKYFLIGKTLNLDNFLENLVNNEDKNKIDVFKKKYNLSIDINEVRLDKKHSLKNVLGNLNIINNKITKAYLNGNFFDNKKIQLTINSSNSGKVTTIFMDKAEPIVSRYKFIKGFEGGILDFNSIQKDDQTNSVLKIYNFKLKELPTLTKILTLASLQGIADILTGEGIRFDEFEMNFTNKNNLMTINEIYAIGPAISILMDGYIEKNKLISLRGTLVPASTINKVVSSIPVLGKILVGSKTGEGVFGVSFKIKGPPKNLQTTVNPIKTLTPRFITRTLEKIKKN